MPIFRKRWNIHRIGGLGSYWDKNRDVEQGYRHRFWDNSGFWEEVFSWFLLEVSLLPEPGFGWIFDFCALTLSEPGFGGIMGFMDVWASLTKHFLSLFREKKTFFVLN